MTKKVNTKIEIRAEILKLIRQKYDNICVGDYDIEELEIVQTELIEMAEMIRDKDKFIKLRENQKQGKSRHITKYFEEDI